MLESTNSLVRAVADKAYVDINKIWYELNVISATLSRSTAIETYLLTQGKDEKAYQTLSAYVNLTKLAANYVDSIIITDFQSTLLFAFGSVDHMVVGNAKRAIDNGLKIKNPVHMQFIEGNNRLAYCINNTEKINPEVDLYTIIIYNLDFFRGIIENAKNEFRVNMALVDSNNEIIIGYSNSDETSDDNSDVKHQKKLLEIDDDLLQLRNLSLMRWRLMVSPSMTDLSERIVILEQFAMVMNILVLSILFGFFVLFSRHINNPIRQILEFMEHQEQNNSKGHLKLMNRSEITSIADGLNNMLEKQRSIMSDNLRSKDRLYKIELAKKQSDIASLTHQISPHFLYNTLDCMRGMAVSYGAFELENIISDIAYIFRYATKARHFVLISDELDCIARYMSIVRIRHNGNILVEFDVQESVKSYFIPKMLLQPIVENAVLHGFETITREGILKIKISESGEFLYISVMDNGEGLAEPKLAELSAELKCCLGENYEQLEHIGLVNIHQRIKLLYGDACGLTIDSQKGVGTNITIKILVEVPFFQETEKERFL